MIPQEGELCWACPARGMVMYVSIFVHVHIPSRLTAIIRLVATTHLHTFLKYAADMYSSPDPLSLLQHRRGWRERLLYTMYIVQRACSSRVRTERMHTDLCSIGMEVWWLLYIHLLHSAHIVANRPDFVTTVPIFDPCPNGVPIWTLPFHGGVVL